MKRFHNLIFYPNLIFVLCLAFFNVFEGVNLDVNEGDRHGIFLVISIILERESSESWTHVGQSYRALSKRSVQLLCISLEERKAVQILLFPPLSGRILGRPHLCLELFFPPRTHFLWILRPILCENHSWVSFVFCPSAHEPCPIIARSSVRAPLLSPKHRVS